MLLTCQQVRFEYPQGTGALQVDAFELQAGQRVFLHGPSGSGKTTFLNLCTGVLKPNSGTVQLAGHALDSLSQAQCDQLRVDHVGFVFQQFNLLPYLNVLDNVVLPCQFSKRRRAQLHGTSPRQAALNLLAQLGLEGKAHQRVAQLSVGQQQRVAVARALIGQPDLVVADEPTSALDEHNRNNFMTLLTEQVQATGAALLLVSHDLRLAEGFDRVLSLSALQQGAKLASAGALV